MFQKDEERGIPMKLEKKVALVTGSSSGIGAAIARGMALAGADVVVNYNQNRAGADKTSQAIQAMGRKSIVVHADVSIGGEVKSMLGKVRECFGKLDILVNNAGITLKKPFEALREDDWDSVINTNLKGAFLCARESIALMPAGGAILNISSIHAYVTTFNFAVYAASKGGLEALTRAMAVELGEKGIRVNALRLGWIQVERDYIDSSDPVYKPICDRIPLRRLGEVDDVVSTAIHLCSSDSSYITGQVLAIDGGQEVIFNTVFAKGHVEGGATS